MVRCEKCTRSNPPTRLSCLYCGAALALPASGTSSLSRRRPVLRPLETGEQGFNCILGPSEKASLTESAISRIAAFLKLEREDCRRIVDSGERLPAARVAELEEATLIKDVLGELGLSISVVADRDLAVDTFPQRRARSITLGDNSVVVATAGRENELSVSWDEVILTVSGRLLASRVEQEERQGRGKTAHIIEAREMSSDEDVLDVYTERHDTSWRISARSFDFSCLGKEMGLLAGENLLRLSNIIRRRARNARYDDSYHRLRKVLSILWPLENRKEARGWHRAGAGRFNTEAVNINDNEMQFSRYSRLLHYLELHKVDSTSQ